MSHRWFHATFAFLPQEVLAEIAAQEAAAAKKAAAARKEAAAARKAAAAAARKWGRDMLEMKFF